MKTHHASLLVPFLLAMACAQQNASEVDTDADGTPTDIPMPDIPDATPCEAGKTRCDGACVDLQANDDNCGICGFSCWEGYDFRGDPYCMWGECTPSTQGCIRKDSGFVTCAEFCASFGEECRDSDDDQNCVVAVELTATPFPDECWIPISFGTDLGCDDPIPYDFVLDGQVYDVAHCCCTHRPQ